MKNKAKEIVYSQARDVKGIFNRFRKRDFSGNTGQVIRNSFYQFWTNVIAKVGSLVFTAIIARIFLPELFGLYSLALGTIVFFSAFSGLGLDSAMITFVAKSLQNKRYSKSKAYLLFIGRIKLWATIIVSLILITISYFLANSYYNKPIFFALLAGGLYLPLASLSRFIETAYTASNDFKNPLKKEILFQIIRIIFIPVLIITLSGLGVRGDLLVSFSILVISACYLLSFLYLWFGIKRNLPFLKSRETKLNYLEKEKIKKFTLPMTATVLSGVFFGYIDMIMLGRFVSEEFIGYYGAAFSLVSSAMVIMSFTAVATFPIFARMSGHGLGRAFWKVLKFSFFISFIGAVVAFAGAEYFILIIYGKSFLQATVFLRYLSLLIMVGTVIGIYSNYFISQERTKIFAITLILVTVINIILNYLFIRIGLKTGMINAVIGACIAVVITKIVYLGILAYLGREKIKEE